VQDTFDFPMEIDLTELSDGSGFVALFDHSYNRFLLLSPLVTGSTIAERQIANGSLITLPNGTRTGDGSNNNTFNYSDLDGNTFTRKVNAFNNSIILDQQGGSLAPVPSLTSVHVSPNLADFGAARLPGGRQEVHLG